MDRKESIEAILFASGEPVPLSRLAVIFDCTKEEIQLEVKNLQRDYQQKGGLKILQLEDTFQMASKTEYSEIIAAYFDDKRKTPLSNASMEVLAVIAYNQPVTKSFIEQVRGIDSSSIVNHLLEKKLVEERGRLKLPGRPITYGTTTTFLKKFSLSGLQDLPKLEEYDTIKENTVDLINHQIGMEEFSVIRE